MVNYLANNLEEALTYRSEKDVIPYGGGTDLMIQGDADASYLFLHRVPEMRRIYADADHLYIGASCTFTEVEQSPLTPAILVAAIRLIGAPAIRNFGTIGGNIGNGSAKADSVLIFFAADARLRLASVRGERIVPIKDFYLGRKHLDLRPDELIVEVILPRAGLDNYTYEKVGARSALAISRLAFAGIMDIRDGIIHNCAVAIGALGDTILRRDDIDAMFAGKTIRQAKEVKTAYLAAYDKAIVPVSGRVSKDYRKEVSMNLLRDFLDKNGI